MVLIEIKYINEDIELHPFFFQNIQIKKVYISNY